MNSFQPLGICRGGLPRNESKSQVDAGMTLGGLHGSDAAIRRFAGTAEPIKTAMQASRIRTQIRVADLIRVIVPQVVRSVQQSAPP